MVFQNDTRAVEIVYVRNIFFFFLICGYSSNFGFKSDRRQSVTNATVPFITDSPGAKTTTIFFFFFFSSTISEKLIRRRVQITRAIVVGWAANYIDITKLILTKYKCTRREKPIRCDETRLSDSVT